MKNEEIEGWNEKNKMPEGKQDIAWLLTEYRRALQLGKIVLFEMMIDPANERASQGMGPQGSQALSQGVREGVCEQVETTRAPRRQTTMDRMEKTIAKYPIAAHEVVSAQSTRFSLLQEAGEHYYQKKTTLRSRKDNNTKK